MYKQAPQAPPTSFSTSSKNNQQRVRPVGLIHGACWGPAQGHWPPPRPTTCVDMKTPAESTQTTVTPLLRLQQVGDPGAR